MKKYRILTVFFVLAIFLFSCGNKTSYKINKYYLGTVIDIEIPLSGINSSLINETSTALENKIKNIDSEFSIFNPDSAVFKINNDKEKNILKADRDLYLLIKKCMEYYHLTDGAFDITVCPLVKLWGFGGLKKNRPPTKEEIDDTLKIVGMDKIRFDDTEQAIKFENPRVEVDFGAIAKGYAVDEAVKILKSHGINSAMINMGGDLYCMGRNPDGKIWRIGIRAPENKDKIIGVICASDKAIATSGDYENYNIYGSARLNHIINPQTGMPVSSNIRSATVLANDCMTADALATAVFVLGEKRGIELVEHLGAECFLALEDAGKLRIVMSKGMGKYLESRR